MRPIVPTVWALCVLNATASCGASSRTVEPSSAMNDDAGAAGQPSGKAGMSSGGATLVCEEHSETWTAPRSEVALVAPAGASMSEVIPGDGRTRWEATRSSLERFVDSVDETRYSVGLILSPSSEGCYPVLSAPLTPLDEQNLVLEALASVEEPGGAGSLEEALAAGIDMLADRPRESRRTVVLLVEAEPTLGPGCVEDADSRQGVIDAVRRATLDVGIDVLPVGLPGSEAANDTLTAIGVYAGTCSTGPLCFVDARTEPDFGDVLARHVAPPAVDVVCEIPFASLPGGVPPSPDASTLVMTLDDRAPELVPRVEACDLSLGWELVDGVARFCPATCDAMLSSEHAVFTATACAPAD
jgi:hypothetical protein